MLLKISQSLCLGFGLISSSALFAAVKEYHLVIDESPINLTGKTVKRITVNGKFPAPLLEFEEGDDAVIHVQKQPEQSGYLAALAWPPPARADGWCPGFNGFQGIKPKQSFTYRFKVRQNGTYWYHAHSKGQEQDGLYGALVIRPKAQTLLPPHEQTERDYVVMLSIFTNRAASRFRTI